MVIQDTRRVATMSTYFRKWNEVLLFARLPQILRGVIIVSSTNYGVIDLQHVLQSLVNCFLTAKAIQVTRNIAPCYIRLSIRDVLPQQNCEAK